MIIHPLFSFGTLKGPIPLLHVWSSYISALNGAFSKFRPFIFCACAIRANIAFRVPASCKHGNKRSGSITKRKRRRERKRTLHFIGLKYLGVYCGIQIWDENSFFPSPPFSSLFMYSSDYAKCTHTLLAANNKSKSSIPSEPNCHHMLYKIGVGLMSVHRSEKMRRGDSRTHLFHCYILISFTLRIIVF